MARTKRTDNAGTTPELTAFKGRFKQPDNVQFRNVTLNDADQEWLATELPNIWQHTAEFFIAAEERLLRVTVTPDGRSGRWNAIAMDCATDSPTYGVALSCRAANPALALFCLAYADFAKDGAWSAPPNNRTNLFG